MEIPNVLVGLIFIAIVVVRAENSFTLEEAKVLEQLRSQVESILTQDFMRRDEYLIRYLRVEGLNVKKAKQRIEETIKWRKSANIDKLFDEDFSQAEKCMPTHWIGHDNGGRPLAFAAAGKWDIRRCALAGYSEKLTRYITFILMEKAERLLANATDSIENKNSVGAYFLTDISGFNLRQGACLLCLPVYSTNAFRFANYYPELYYKITLVNVAKSFDSILDVVLPFLPPQTARRVHTYGHNRDEWLPIIEKDMDTSQLPPSLMGKKSPQ